MNTASLLLLIIAAAFFLQMPAHASEPVASATNTAAYQSGVAQEQLRLASLRLKQEMAALADEYRGYHAAAPEIAKLQSAIKSLDQVSALDMAHVVRTLMAASHNDNPTTVRDNLLTANTSQKSIQATLRNLADKLAQQADAATLQKRLEELAIRQSENLQATRRLAAQAASPNKPSEKAQLDVIHDLAMRNTEQHTLEKEIGSAMATLRKFAKAGDPASGKPLMASLATAESGKLEQQAKDASTSLEQAPAESSKHQQQVLDNLKTMASQLAEARTTEEQTRELADAIAELSQNEQSLADKSPKLDHRNQAQAQQGQQNVASRLDVLKDRVAKLSAKTAPETDHAIERSQNIADKLANPNFIRDPNNLALTADSQKDLAKQLAKISNALQQQADALAAADAPQPEPQPEMSAEEKAIQEAMAALLEAKANNALAGRQNDQKQDYQERLAMTREEMATAAQQVAQAGAEVAKNVDQSLKDAENHASLAADKQAPGHHLYHVNVNIDKALATLQEAANQLATADSKDQQPKDGQGLGVGTAGSGTGSGPGHGKGAYAGGRATSDAQRDALSLLKQEKSAPEYLPMVNQYITNLANENNPGH